MNGVARADTLNRHCACESTPSNSAFDVYSHRPVFVASEHVRAMRELIGAVHAVSGLPGWQHSVLCAAPESARIQTSAKGVFDGFDFHITADGPRLIEINTNAGGAMINATASWRHPACCIDNPGIRAAPSRAELEAQFIAMFQAEWQRHAGSRPWRSLAIVDDQPEQQFLYREFQAFAELFARQGIDAFVADAAELEHVDGQLRWRGKTIDLVYNRLTDFYLELPSHAALLRAWQTQSAVITPHPRAHALLASKRNLALLTDRAFLQSIGAAEADIAILQTGIPRTRCIEGHEDDWWRERKQWFFKPEAGYGGRGAYRGDKITRRAFAEVMRGGYVAQQLALPGERMAGIHAAGPFKVDLRLYAHDGQVQFMAARLYQGQTTNFRTPGGGFAPVLELTGSQTHAARGAAKSTPQS